METINLNDYNLSYLSENLELIIYSLVAFFIPFLIGHPQIIVGIIVNTALVLTALNLKNEKLLPIIILPSLGVLSRGLIFGPYTIFLIYMIPIIWLSNYFFIYFIKYFQLRNKVNKYISLFLSGLIKTTILFTFAYIFVKLNLIPVIFLASMGIIQLYTAFIGGIIGLTIHSAKKRI